MIIRNAPILIIRLRNWFLRNEALDKQMLDKTYLALAFVIDRVPHHARTEGTAQLVDI